MKECVIIVPTYFGGPLVANCVNSITKNVRDAQVFVYKNDIGWLAACNKIAGILEGHDIILLNDDTLVLTDIVKEMQELAYSDETIGIVGGKALAADGEHIINYGIYVAADGNTAHRYYGQPKDSVEVEEQQAVEGSCMFIKHSALSNGRKLFDENYGMGYREEVDLCFRVRESGYKVMSCPTAEYIHYVNQTHGKLGITNDRYEYFMNQWGKKLALGKL